MKIGKRIIGKDPKTFIIAEIGNNHDQDFSRAVKLIKLAAESGADAVKFQTFQGLDICTASQLSSDYKFKPAEKFEFWHEYLDTIALPFEWYPDLIKETKSQGMAFLSTPCSLERAAFLKEVGADALKIASMDNNNLPFLKDVAKLEMPVILSTGMAELTAIGKSLAALSVPGVDVAVLHCISEYPTIPEHVSLPTLEKLKAMTQFPIGFSDHSLKNYSAFAAVAMGATIVEKHFTDDRSLPGPDHFFSQLPAEFAQLVEGVREIEKAMIPLQNKTDLNRKEKMQRTLRFKRTIEPGEIVTADDIEIKRPAGGLEPEFNEVVIGMRITKRAERDGPITWSHFK